ncbi:MAG: methylated-DNA--[protein]-cysteine S-methyltransferase [Marinicellaceae bacterium]
MPINQVKYCLYSSPVGQLLLAGDKGGLSRIQFECKIKIDEAWQRDDSFFKEEVSQLKEYFSHKRKHFDLKLNPQGTQFQKAVWKRLIQIQFGKTKYYAEIAEEINNPKAARAIGMANNKNPIPIIIPCHRVIGKTGNLTGFAGGLEVKSQLLKLEGLLINKKALVNNCITQKHK